MSGIWKSGLVALSGIAACSILGWAVPALLMLNRGFSVHDEGTYLLAYRWWRTNPYSSTGSQYFYGPIFDFFDESVPALRLLRLAMVLVCNAIFAVAFCRWLVRYRSLPMQPWLWTSAMLILIASGGLPYLWQPLSPGYYDLAAGTSLILVALFLARIDDPGRPAIWIPVAAGCVSFILLLTKWPAVSVVAVTTGGTVWVLAKSSVHRAASYAAAFGGGFLGAAVLFHVFFVRLDRLVPAIRQVTDFAARSPNHSPGYVVQHSLDTTLTFTLAAVAIALPSFASIFVARLLARSGPTRIAVTTVCLGTLGTGTLAPLLSGWRGGAHAGRAMVAVIVACLIVALLAAWLPISRSTHRPSTTRSYTHRVVVAVLMLVPFGQALGTNVPVVYVAGTCLAMWVAIAYIGVTRGVDPGWRHAALGSHLGTLIVTVALIGGSTTLLSPFKTTPYREDTVSVSGLGGLRISPTTADEYAALERALSHHIVPGATPVIALDEKAGLTYLLGGVPVGPTWTDLSSTTATAGIVRLACRNGDVDATMPLVILADRPVDSALASSLNACGWRFPDDFHELHLPGGPPGLTVMVA